MNLAEYFRARIGAHEIGPDEIQCDSAIGQQCMKLIDGLSLIIDSCIHADDDQEISAILALCHHAMDGLIKEIRQ